MTDKVPHLISVRRLVNELILAGKFKAPEDPLIYAIKEREHQEIAHRIDTVNKSYVGLDPEGKSWGASLGHLARIFYRDDVLEADDYQYLFSVLSNKSKGVLLSQLVKGNCDGHDVLGGEPNVWISTFLKAYAGRPRDELEISMADAILNDGRLAKLLSVHVPRPDEAALIHLQVEQTVAANPRAHRMNLELHYLKSAFAGAAEAAGQQDAEKWIREYNLVLELRKENAKDISGKTQITLIDNYIRQIQAAAPVLQALDPELRNPGSATQGQIQAITRLLTASLHEDLDHLLTFMNQKPTTAVLAFGKPENKGDGQNIPTYMLKLVKNLDSELVPADKSGRLLERMVVTLLSVNRKNIPSTDVRLFLDKVKDKVDWQVVVESLNSKGRAVLIDLMPDTRPFRAYLTRAERGKTLENDLGM